MDRKLMLGQRLMYGFPGTELDDNFIRLVREYKIGNVILFRRNVRDAVQLRKLCADIQALILKETGYPALIGIDQEGGTVTRLSDDCVNTQGNMAMAAAGRDAAYRASAINARQLRGTGPNCNLAPDLDVNNNADNPVIGARSFGDDPKLVGMLGIQALKGYEEYGVMCCGKHFPGHGDTAVDSHRGLPVIDKTLEELRQVELVPFNMAIQAGVPGIMSSHILFPRVDDGVPATMSRRIMHDLLREECGFSGLVFSDCMMMDAIRKYYGTASGVVAAARAGVDIILVSHADPVQQESAEALLQAELDEKEIEESFLRILKMKERYAFTEAVPELAGRTEDRTEVTELAKRAVVHVCGELPAVDADTLYVGCDVHATSMVENDGEKRKSFPHMLRELLGGTAVITSVNPEDEEIADIAEKAKNHSTVVLCTMNAHLRPGQARLARALCDTGIPVTAVMLRNPYDLPVLKGCRAVLAAWDDQAPACHAVAEILQGGRACGKLPVTLKA